MTTTSTTSSENAVSVGGLSVDRTNAVTPWTGAAIKPGPMVTAPPPRVISDDDLADFASNSGLNAPSPADLLSSFITHERDGVNLFRMLGSTTQNPMLQAEYAQLVGEAESSVRIWSQLIRDLGGSDTYASPPARLTELMDAKVIESFLGVGSADPLSIEMAGVSAVLQAAQLCVAHAELLRQLGEEAQGEAQQTLLNASDQLTAAATAHVEWATSRMTTMAKTQAKHPLAQKVGQAAEKVVGKVKDALH